MYNDRLGRLDDETLYICENKSVEGENAEYQLAAVALEDARR